MKLFATSKFSPYASRVRLAVYAKDLPVELAPAPGDGGPHHPQYLAINPLGKIPSLLLDDGTVIVESDTIVEYFADAFPDAQLRPDGAEARAQARMLSRIAELYVLDAVTAIFGQMDPKTRSWSVAALDQARVGEIFAKVDRHLGHLDHFMSHDRYAVGDRFSTADCALVPVLAFVGGLAEGMGLGDVLAPHAKVAGYWSRAKGDAAIGRVAGEMHEFINERIKP